MVQKAAGLKANAQAAANNAAKIVEEKKIEEKE
jgi:hypothetical protein